ncbi:MAG: DUF305 domain-containing protein [Ornithinimicrobium sp.]
MTPTRARADHATRSPYAVVAVISAVLVTAMALLIAASGRGPDGQSVDAGFSRDMSEHHAQAVDMSLIVLQASDSRDIDVVAYDIATTQSNQIGRMQGWLVDWNLPQARSEDRMAWMPDGSMSVSADGMDGMDDASTAAPGTPGYRAMPGMASLAEMAELRSADPAQAEILYLQLMITHHLAGVAMAQAAVDHAEDPQVRDLAQAMVNGQRSEIRLMADLLATRDASPREDLRAVGY